ncbi:MAG TPA: hypothetical protein VE953_09680 [Terriglobales bacterium]|nr:hypothetical protein [Terriglobales bacterium]
MTREAGFKRRVRARMAKTGEAYSAARTHLDSGVGSPAPRVLHITNGDSVSGTLREARVPGEVLTWAEVLHDGPVPAGTPAELHRTRARHLAARGWADAADAERQFAERERLLGSYTDGRYVLWFEADLFDQLLLLQVLDALSRLGADPARATLVSVGEYRGIAHFAGLGQLTTGQLAPLAGEGTPLTPEAMGLAASAWAAFRSADPAGLAGLTGARSPELRFLGEAFGRLLQEYPSRTDGLSLTQRRILLAAADGPAPAGRIFRTISQQERRPFLGDTSFFAYLGDLAACEVPLLTAGDGVRLTAAGREVLAGREDHARLNGIDRWIGGVHLVGRAPAWRYDERLEVLTPG